MKLGMSYNVFDGEELLKYSILPIRKHIDYISVVYQEVSNFGMKCTDKLLPLLKELKDSGLVDQLYCYVPKVNNDYNATNQDQEVEKRNIGLRLSRQNGCTHHMSLDVDEFYTPEQFKFMRDDMENSLADVGACKHCQYYKDSIYILNPKEEEFVSTIFKIYDYTQFVFDQLCCVAIDPTRKCNNSMWRIYNRAEVEMHHMSFVRNDLRRKIMNHSSRVGIINNIDKICDYYDNWKYPNPAMWAGGNLISVIEIPRLFSIKD